MGAGSGTRIGCTRGWCRFVSDRLDYGTQKDAILEAPDRQWRDYRSAPEKGVHFRKGWMFKGDAITRILTMLDGAPHPWVHVCCGASKIPGEDVRVDLHHPSATLQIDAQDLDKHIQGAGAIVIDPPYGWDLAVRMRAMQACARALGPGGVMVVHAPWQPNFVRSYMARREPVYVRDNGQMDWPNPPVMLVAYDKSSNPALSGGGGVEANRKERKRRGKARGRGSQ